MTVGGCWDSVAGGVCFRAYFRNRSFSTLVKSRHSKKETQVIGEIMPSHAVKNTEIAKVGASSNE